MCGSMSHAQYFRNQFSAKKTRGSSWSKTFSIGGIHPNDSKFSKDVSIVDLPVPERVFLPMNQHLGIPAAPGSEER